MIMKTHRLHHTALLFIALSFVATSFFACGKDSTYPPATPTEKPKEKEPEKPKEGEEFSNLSVLGRVLLTPDVFDIIDALEPGAGGEYQLTDAMKKIAVDSGVYALEFEGERYDMGSKTGFLKANVVKGLTHPETADEFRAFIKELAKELE